MATHESRLATDPDAPIPPAVARAVAEADRIQQEYIAGLNQQPVVLEAAPSLPPISASATPPAPLPPAPAPQPVVVTPPGTPPAELDEEGNPIDWRRLAMSYRGRMEQMRQQIVQLQTQAQTQNAPTPAASAQPVVVNPDDIRAMANAAGISEEDQNNWGDDMLRMVAGMARVIATGAVAPLQERVQQTAKQVQDQERVSVQSYLTQHLPTWRAQNDNPLFGEWLALPDPMSGVIRHDLLTEAYNSGDAPRVLNIFKGFKSGAVPPAGDQSLVPTPTLEGEPPSQRVPLETFAAPGRPGASGAVPQAEPAKPTYTTASISAFYARKMRGDFHGREAEVEAVEQDIYAAQRDGRFLG